MRQMLGAQRASYRQGLVLGLTMAEVMLLMVFTFMLVAGALLQKSHARVKVLEKEREALTANEQELIELRAMRKRLTAAGIDRIPDNWHELVRVDEFLKTLQSKSVDERSLVDAVEVVSRAKASLETLGYRLADVKQIPITILQNTPRARSASMSGSNEAGHNWPPIIRLSEADHYSFQLGKAEISDEFRGQLIQTIIPKLVALIHQYDVDVIEVIGHTDEAPIADLTSNLDAQLVNTLHGTASADALTFSDNAGLAMARASAVARVLMEDERLNGFRILPLSGAQVITTDERITSGDDPRETAARRRIEIRVRRTSAVQ